MKIDFVSDVACPWCAVGLHSLEAALRGIGSDVSVDIHFQPFELNPDMRPEGEDAAAYLTKKYGMSAQQLAQGRETLRQRGAAVGFVFGERARVWNTFDAHRMLYWAGLEGNSEQQHGLKRALLAAYHTEGENPGAHDVLLRLAGELGLGVERARAVLASDEFAAEVRERERFYQQQGIYSVPAVIINDQHLISGGQPPEVFEQALRQIAAQAAG